MYTVEFTSSFMRDLKKYKKQGGDTEKVRKIIKLLQNSQPLPQTCKDHQLKGKMNGYRELHIEPDRLLVYEKDGKNLRIVCLWLVSHQKLNERERNASL